MAEVQEDVPTPMDENVEEEADPRPASEEPAAEAEAPSSSKKQPKAKKAGVAPAQEAAAGRSKRERKSVDFFVPDMSVREKKSEKPKEVRWAGGHALFVQVMQQSGVAVQEPVWRGCLGLGTVWHSL
jgi:hypothetical protein